MSYKIVSCAPMKHINNDSQINVPPSASINPCSSVMKAADTEGLLAELAGIRDLALRIPPVRNDILGPINTVIDAVWDLEQRLRLLVKQIPSNLNSGAGFDTNAA